MRLLEVLRAAGRDVHLSISPSGADVIRQELGLAVDLDDFRAESILLGDANSIESGLPLLESTAPLQRLRSRHDRQTGRLSYYHCKTSWPRWPAARFSPPAW